VTVVQADYDDEESLVAAFQDAEAVFGLTNFFDPAVQNDPDVEVRQGRRMGDVCKRLGVSVFIWSTSPSGLVGGSPKSQRVFENKYAVSQYLAEKEIPHVDVYVGTYMDNWRRLGGFARTEDGGSLQLTLPVWERHAKIGLTYVEKDLGATVVAVLDNYRAKPAILTEPVYCIAGLWSSGDFVQEIERQLGEDVSLITTSTCGNPYLDHAYRSFNAWGVALDVNLPHPSHTLLGIELHTLEDYVREDIVPFVKASETLRIP
jgi:uncharacterized protein YbjT (DUF2867 family)